MGGDHITHVAIFALRYSINFTLSGMILFLVFISLYPFVAILHASTNLSLVALSPVSSLTYRSRRLRKTIGANVWQIGKYVSVSEDEVLEFRS